MHVLDMFNDDDRAFLGDFKNKLTNEDKKPAAYDISTIEKTFGTAAAYDAAFLKPPVMTRTDRNGKKHELVRKSNGTYVDKNAKQDALENLKEILFVDPDNSENTATISKQGDTNIITLNINGKETVKHIDNMPRAVEYIEDMGLIMRDQEVKFLDREKEKQKPTLAIKEAMFPNSEVGNKLRNADSAFRGSDMDKALAVGSGAALAGSTAGVTLANASGGAAATLFLPALGAGLLTGALAVLSGVLTYKALKWVASKVFGTTEEALSFAKAHLAAAQAGAKQFEWDGKTYPVKLTNPKQIAELQHQISDLRVRAMYEGEFREFPNTAAVEVPDEIAGSNANSFDSRVAKLKAEMKKLVDRAHSGDQLARQKLAHIDSTSKLAEVDEDAKSVHRIGLTVTDPNHPMVSKRKETIQKTVKVTSNSRDKAISAAIAHCRKKGYKVHDHHYIGTVDEGWLKNTVASAALAGAALTGAGHAQAADLSQFGTPYLQQVASGQHPRPMVNVDDAKAELQAREQGKQQTVAPVARPETPSGYSIDYLKKAADPNRNGRYLLSIEQAQEMLKQATVPRATQVNELSKDTLRSYSNERGATIRADRRDAEAAADMADDYEVRGDGKKADEWDNESKWLRQRAERGGDNVAKATIKIAKKKPSVAEGSVAQLPTRGADYSKYDTDHLKMLLRPGILHRDEARFKALIRKELQKREQQGQQGVAEGLTEMDNRTPSGDRREQRANSPEAKAQREKEQQKRLKDTSPEMRKKLRLPEPKEGVAEGSEKDMSKEVKAMATGKCPHCHGPVEKKEHPTLTQYHCAKCGIRGSIDKQGVAEGKGLAKKVKVVKGEHAGKTGWIREIKHGAFNGAPKTYYIDLDDGGQANNLPATALRLVKEPGVAEGSDTKFTGYWKGTDTATPGKKMVGSVDEGKLTAADSPDTWIKRFQSSNHPALSGKDSETLKRMALAARTKELNKPPSMPVKSKTPKPVIGNYWWQEKNESAEPVKMSMRDYIKEADRLHDLMQQYDKIGDEPNYQKTKAAYLELEQRARQGMIPEGEQITSGRPRVRKVAIMRPDGTKSARFEVLNHAGVRIGPLFDDAKWAKEYLQRHYLKLINLDEDVVANPTDTVTMDVPMLIRIMEFAREDAKTDMDLHDVAEKLIDLSSNGTTLTMKDYDQVVPATNEPAAQEQPPVEPQLETRNTVGGRYWDTAERRWRDQE